VVAPREEATLIENPEVNIRGMFSWAKPSDEMVTKLFRGEGCPVDGYLDEWRRPGLRQAYHRCTRRTRAAEHSRTHNGRPEAPVR